MLERCVDLACEVSVIVARDDDGESSTWPVAENRHRDGILDVSIVPARVRRDARARARATSRRAVAAALDYRGVLCVEMFVTRDGALLVNEIAPRPHNSGHYTIDACVTSQFEQQARVLAGLPLGDHAAAHARGDGEPAGRHLVRRATTRARASPTGRACCAHPRAKLHLYGKREPRRGRKMGHVTCLGPTLDAALATARAIKRELGIPGADAL